MPTESNRNMYLVLLAGCDQFQEYRAECTAYNTGENGKLKPHAARQDPIRDFPGIDISRVRRDTDAYVTSKRKLKPYEVRGAYDYLSSTKPPFLVRTSDGSYTFKGKGSNGERLGAELRRFRVYLENKTNRRCWPGLVVLSVMQDGVPRSVQGHLSRSGLSRKDFDRGVRQLGRGFNVVDGTDKWAHYQGPLIWSKEGHCRLPDTLLFNGAADTDLDDVFPDAPDDIVDTGDTSSADEILQAMKKVGVETGGAPTPGIDQKLGLDSEHESENWSPTSIVVQEPELGSDRESGIWFPIPTDQLEVLNWYLKSKGMSLVEPLQRTLSGLVSEALEARRVFESKARARLAELDRERRLNSKEQDRILRDLGDFPTRPAKSV